MTRAAAFALLLAAVGCTAPSRAGALGEALAELLADPELAGGRIGVLVADAVTGAVLAEHDADRGFAPASNQKLLSAAIALATLGPAHTMTTELVGCGTQLDRTFHGDLVLRGHGDPTLGEGLAGAAVLAAFANALRDAGIASIGGSVRGDGSWLGPEHRGLGWQWDYLDDDYAAPFCGLCWHGNVVTVLVRPGSDGPAAPAIRFVPFPEEFPVVSVTQGPAGSATSIDVRHDLRRRELLVTGTIAADAPEQRIRVAVRDPARFAADALVGALRGIIAVEAATAEWPRSERVFARHQSPPLAAIVKSMLTDSNNLYAEQVWRVAARTATGDGGTASAERHGKAVLGSLGVDVRGLVLADGSGLSRRNLVRPRQLVALLRAMHGSPLREVFSAGLPVAGVSGTLRSRFGDGPASGRVRGKTGYIARVVCLSGYVPRPDPAAAPLVFSVMLNDFTCGDAAAKAAADRFVQHLAASVGWTSPAPASKPVPAAARAP